MSGKAKGKNREQRSAPTYGPKEAAGGRTADGIDDKIDVSHIVFGFGLRVVDELVGTQFAEERFVPG